VKIALFQINPTVGDLHGNSRLIAEASREAARLGADLAVTPELALVGYLPRDLLLNDGFVRRSRAAAASLALEVAALPPVLVDCRAQPSDEGRPLYNTAVLLRRPNQQRFRKALLDLRCVRRGSLFRAFSRAATARALRKTARHQHCEDVWNDRDFERRRYHHDPIEELKHAGAEAIVNLSASPFSAGKRHLRSRCWEAWRASTACRSST
jgi:NAD+ synthase/NAD+ synthase (glutamine-hydrolysing)